MDTAKGFASQKKSFSEALSGNWSRPAFHVADMAAANCLPLPDGETRGQTPRRPAEARISQPLVVGALFLFDALNFSACGFLAFRAIATPSLWLEWDWLWPNLAFVTLVGLALLQARWSYTIQAIANFPRQCFSLAVALGGALALSNAASVMIGIGESQVLREWTLHWFLGGLTAGCGARAVFALAVGTWTRQGRLARRTVIVGGGPHALDTIQEIERSGKGAIQILGVFDDRNRVRLPEGIDDYRLLGSFDDLETFCRDQKVDLLIVTIPPSAETRLLQILRKLWVLPVDVRISALGGKLKLRNRAYNFIGDAPFLPVFDKPIYDWHAAVKSIFDRIVTALLILILSPVLALTALGVKLSSPGPILFRQNRYGFNNEQFPVYKFRSMYVDKCDATAKTLVTRGDPRVTPFGAFIRRTSLDELPQLFNVLRGDLSLVGPRPHALSAKAAGMIYERVVDGYFARHRVKPGITGWAQINGWRGETDTIEKIEQRVAHDLYYIENWSILLDIKILALTPVVVLTGANAF